MLPPHYDFLTNKNATLRYRTLPSPFAITSNSSDFHNNPLGKTERILDFQIKDTPIQICFQLPGTYDNPAYQYFYQWNKICNIRLVSNKPLPQSILLTLWFDIMQGNQGFTSARLWSTLIDNHPHMPFPNLIKRFLSLVHYFGFGYNHNVPDTYIPNRVLVWRLPCLLPMP